MELKEGVILAGLDIRMRPALVAADRVYKAYDQELVITAGLDGTHSAGSLHYYGLAIDCRTRFFRSLEEIEQVAVDLRTALGIAFQVIVEANHIHIEYDA